MENYVHEVYDGKFQQNVFKGYGTAGYNACMDYMNRRHTDGNGFHLEYFMTEPEGRNWDDIEKMLPVSVYKDTTGQYTDEEIDDPCDPWSNIVEIPVPQDLLWQWYMECAEFDREQCPDDEPSGGWGDITVEDMLRWVWEESTCDETYALYDWLTAHNYFWKRLD